MDEILSVNVRSVRFEHLLSSKEDDELKELAEVISQTDVERCKIIKRELAARSNKRRFITDEYIDDWNHTTRELHEKLTGGYVWI